MSNQVKAASTTGPSLGAGAAGAGSGTLLVLLANNLPDSYWFKSWLVIIAPSASIAVSVFWIWLKVRIDSYTNQRALKTAIIKSKQTLKEALENPNTSTDHRRQLRKELEQLEMLLIRSDLAKVKALTEDTQENVAT